MYVFCGFVCVCAVCTHVCTCGRKYLILQNTQCLVWASLRLLEFYREWESHNHACIVRRECNSIKFGILHQCDKLFLEQWRLMQSPLWMKESNSKKWETGRKALGDCIRTALKLHEHILTPERSSQIYEFFSLSDAYRLEHISLFLSVLVVFLVFYSHTLQEKLFSSWCVRHT